MPLCLYQFATCAWSNAADIKFVAPGFPGSHRHMFLIDACIQPRAIRMISSWDILGCIRNIAGRVHVLTDMEPVSNVGVLLRHYALIRKADTVRIVTICISEAN